MNNMNMNKSSIATPNPALQFMFAMFGIFTWLSALIKIPYDSQTAMGILQISLGIGCFAGSILNLVKGDSGGNINLVLSVILGFTGGINTLISVRAAQTGTAYHPYTIAIILLFGAIYMVCFLPMKYEQAWYVFVSHFAVVCGFLFSSLAVILGLPVFKIIGAWCLFIFAITALFDGVVEMYASMGRKIGKGRSFKSIFNFH